MISRKTKIESENFDASAYLNENWLRLSTIAGLKLNKIITGLSASDVSDVLTDVYLRVSSRMHLFQLPHFEELSGKSKANKSKSYTDMIDASLVSWLTTIAWRLSLNDKRKYARLVYVDPTSVLIDMIDSKAQQNCDFWNQMVKKEHIEYLKDHLISEEEYLIFDQLLLGAKHHEISRDLDLNQNTVHTRIYRMFSRLSELVKKEFKH
jgi:hypothetical protein